jgi:hypothetical protein
MATMFEICTTEEQRSVVPFLWAKGLNAKDIHIEIFLICGGKCLCRKAVRNWVEKFSQGRSKVVDDARTRRRLRLLQKQRLLSCGFRRTGKAMEQA